MKTSINRFIFLGVLLCLNACAPTAVKPNRVLNARTVTLPELVLEYTPPVDVHKPNKQTITHKKPTPKHIYDLHDRLINGYALNIDEHEHPRIENYIRWLQRHPKHMRKLCKNAQPYLHYIIDLLEKNNMPLEIALIPAIESSYNPRAVSRMGATGMWQIMPRTADHLNIKRNKWFDGRKDIHISTVAALNYLKYINRMFNGDWLLTLAGYNAGPNGIQRIVNKARARGKSVDYWSLPLHKETLRYVPKILALAKVLANPSAYRVQQCTLPNKAVIHRARVHGSTDVQVLARLANLSLRAFENLNPAHQQSITPPHGTHHVYIPSNRAVAFTRKERALPQSRRRVVHQYRVKAGDTVSQIARTHNLSVQDIMNFNGMRTSQLRIRQVLKIPKNGLQHTAPRKPSRIKRYTVKKGDNLWRITRKFGITQAQLRKWNGRLSITALKVGLQLIVGR